MVREVGFFVFEIFLVIDLEVVWLVSVGFIVFKFCVGCLG